MARITVEDCLDKVDNRFQLVMISSKRARQLQVEGKEPMLPVDKDKPTVIALREIADGLVDVGILNEKPTVEAEIEETEGEGNGEAKLEAPSEDDLAVAQEMQAVADEELEQKAEQEEEPPEQV